MLTAVRYAVRPMAPNDIRQVVDIERESFSSMWPQTTYKRELQNRLARYFVVVQEPSETQPLPPAPAPLSSGWRRSLRRLLRQEPSSEPTRELVLGFVGLWLIADEAHIVTLAVRQDHRRRGIGELLLIAGIETAVARGQEVITLEVRRSNEAAISLYAKYGFVQAGIRRGYYTDDHEDAVIMTTRDIGSSAFQERYRSLKEEHRDRLGLAFNLPADL